MIQVVGKPTSSDIFLMGTDCKMAEDGLELLKYIEELSPEQSKTLTPLNQLCSQGSPQALDLLQKMLAFAPKNRISAVDSFTHPYFQEFGLMPSQSDSELNPHTDLTSTISDEIEQSDNDLDQQEDLQLDQQINSNPQNQKELGTVVGNQKELLTVTLVDKQPSTEVTKDTGVIQIEQNLPVE